MDEGKDTASAKCDTPSIARALHEVVSPSACALLLVKLLCAPLLLHPRHHAVQIAVPLPAVMKAIFQLACSGTSLHALSQACMHCHNFGCISKHAEKASLHQPHTQLQPYPGDHEVMMCSHTAVLYPLHTLCSRCWERSSMHHAVQKQLIAQGVDETNFTHKATYSRCTHL